MDNYTILRDIVSALNRNQQFNIDSEIYYPEIIIQESIGANEKYLKKVIIKINNKKYFVLIKRILFHQFNLKQNVVYLNATLFGCCSLKKAEFLINNFYREIIDVSLRDIFNFEFSYE